jgi:hypothetical protein
MQAASYLRSDATLVSTVGLALVASFFGTLALLKWLDGAPQRPEIIYVQGFDAQSSGPKLFLSGWSKPEHWGTWTDGARAKLRWSLDHRPAADIHASVKGIIYPSVFSKRQSIKVVVNNTPVAVLEKNASGELYGGNFSIPNSVAVAQTPMRIEFVIDKPVSPRSLGEGDDDRKLGLGLESIELAYQSE